MAREKKRRRRQFRELEVVETLLLQGAVFLCRHCGQPITLEDLKARNVQKEHKHEFELDGPDIPDNCCFSHAKRPCHAQETHGSLATFAGSSRHRIAKANEPERTAKFVVNKSPLGLVAKVDAGAKCRGCGEFMPDCKCPKREPRPSFRRRA